MKIKLTWRQHNKLFPNRKAGVLTYYELVDDHQKRSLEMYQYIRMPVRVVAVLLSPLAIFVGGVPAMIDLIKECTSKVQVGADTVGRDWFYEEFSKMKGGEI